MVARVCFKVDAILDVGPVKPNDKLLGITQREVFNNFLAGSGVGGCREGHSRNRREFFVQQIEREVVNSEIMAPLGDAMRLIDGKEANGDAFE